MVITEVVGVGKELIDSENAKGFINRILTTFFGKSYVQYLTRNSVLRGVAELEAKKQLDTFSKDPNPMLSFIQSESEIEYRNMFGVLAKAMNKIDKGVPSNNDVNFDTMKRLKDLSKDFSSEDMQNIVASILAGEYNNPGTYSLKTIDTVKSLSKNDIELFRKFCGIVFDNKYFFRNFYDVYTNELKLLIDLGIGYDEYLYLQDIGLVGNRNTSMPFGNINDSSTEFYYDFSLQNKNIRIYKKGVFSIPSVSSLTKAGEELLTVTGFYDNDILFNLVKNEIEGYSDRK